MLCRLHTVYKIIHCVALHTLCLKSYSKMVNLLRYIWKNLHLPKKIYTGTARGARDKYQVWIKALGWCVKYCSPFFSQMSYMFHTQNYNFCKDDILVFDWLKPNSLHWCKQLQTQFRWSTLKSGLTTFEVARARD